MPELTHEQSLAVSARHPRILVCASAGTGKTHVLTQRYLHLVLNEGIEVRQILAVTFTEAAAAEMRTRIAQALRQTLSALTSPAQADWLRRQLLLLERAPISTLHSFCLRIVREFFYLVELDPDFRVLDPVEAEVLKRDALDDTMESWFEERPSQVDEPAFYRLVDEYGGLLAGEGLPRLVLDLHAFLQTLPDPERWWHDVLHVYEISPTDELKTRIARAFREFVDPQRWSSAVAELHQLAPLIRVLRTLLEDFIRRYQRAKNERAVLDFADLERLTQQLLTHSQVLALLQRRYRHILVDEYQDINPLQNWILETLAGQEPEPTRQLFMVGDDKQSIYGFRLACPALFQQKALRYRAIGHDARFNPNDSDDQVSANSDEPDAGPTNVMRLEQSAASSTAKLTVTALTAQSDGIRVPLTVNFRSQRTILDAVNIIFSQLSQFSDLGLRYDEDVQLRFGAAHYDADGLETNREEPVTLYVFAGQHDQTLSDQGESGEGSAQPLTRWERLTREARLAAWLIEQWVGKLHVWDTATKTFRPAEYRDVAILMRTVQGRAQYVVETLRSCGIPVHVELRRGFWQALEIRDMTALLQLLRNPLDDVPLAAVLRSPLVGLEVADLAQIRLAQREGPFYWALHQYVHQKGEDRLAEKIRAFLDQLETWRTRARRQPLARLLWDIYRETGYLAFVQALPDGAARSANLILLHDLARQFERNRGGELERFLHYLERLREQEQDFGPANVVSPTENVVRLLSIHQSKGLEFPIVLVLDLGSEFNEESLRQRFLFHRDGLLGARVQDERGVYSWPTELYRFIQHELRKEFLAEELRLLYVAMTRARERLVLIATHNRWTQPRKSARSRPEQSDEKFHLAADQIHSSLQWLLPVFRRATQNGYRALRLQEISSQDPVIHDFPAGSTSEPREDGQEPSTLSDGTTSSALSRDDWFNPTLWQRLHWKYPHHWATVWPGKTSPTRLRLWLERDEDTAPWSRGQRGLSLTSRPSFPRESPTLDNKHESTANVSATTPAAGSAVERGQLVHRLIRHLTISASLDSLEELQRQLSELTEQGIFSESEASAVDLHAVANFFRRSLGQRIVRARKVVRELPFSLMLPAQELPMFAERLESDLTQMAWEQLGQERVLVQGVMDLVFWESGADGPILVDFKTDNLTVEELSEAQHRYAPQLGIYARALETALGQRCREVWLVFLTLGQDCLMDMETLITCLRPSPPCS